MELPQDKSIILFDGVCNLCDSVVQRIIKADKKDQFRFIALQSNKGKTLLTQLGINPLAMDSIVFYQPGKGHWIKSQAVVHIAAQLKGIYRIVCLANLFPQSWMDRLYEVVANNRYRLFGKKSSCLLPDKKTLDKFL
ncbi:thiol-disulfide oxidoreductase DCC family protein [Myroides sp. LJL116]